MTEFMECDFGAQSPGTCVEISRDVMSALLQGRWSVQNSFDFETGKRLGYGS